jgi:hypothetical protein
MPWDASKDELDYPFAKTFEAAMESAKNPTERYFSWSPTSSCRYCGRKNNFRGLTRCGGCGRTLWEKLENNPRKRRPADGTIQEGARVQIRKIIPRLRSPFLKGSLAVTSEVFEGEVRLILADDPEWTKNVRLLVERENGALEEVSISCLVAVIEEHHRTMDEMTARTRYTHQRIRSEHEAMTTDAYITKGARVRVDLTKAQPIGTYSLAGAQLKVAATRECFEGIVRHIWADDPEGRSGVCLQLEREDGTLVEVPPACVVAVLDEETKG